MGLLEVSWLLKVEQKDTKDWDDVEKGAQDQEPQQVGSQLFTQWLVIRELKKQEACSQDIG